MDRLFGFEAIPGFAARLYTWASARRAIVQDLFSLVEEAVASTLCTGKILDVGTGPGLLPLRLAHRFPDVRIEGVDLSPTMVRLARLRAAREGMANRVAFMEGSASALPCPAEAYDLVLSTLSLHHWRDRAGAFREICRVLRPGGAAWLYDIRRRTPPEVDQMAAKRYGRWETFLFLRVVRLHSSVDDSEARTLLQGPAALFPRRRLEERGLFWRFVLEKDPLDMPKPRSV